MGQIFDKTRDEMNNWRWDNPCAFSDQVYRSNPQTTSSGKVKRTAKRFSGYGSDDLRVKIELPSCPQYKPGDFLGFGPLYWEGIIDEADDDETWVDPGAPSSGKSHPGDANDNDNGEGQEDTPGGGNGTDTAKGTKDGKGKGKGKGKAMEEGKGKRKALEEGKGKGKGNSIGKGIVNQTPGEDDISHAIALQLQNEMNEAD